MKRFHAFRIAANQGGFVKVNESDEGTVLWLSKNASNTTRETHQRMCIDRLTNSATVYSATITGIIKSKTFRGVRELQEWLGLAPEPTPER